MSADSSGRNRLVIQAIVLLLLCIFVALQYRLWFAGGSLVETRKLQYRLDEQQAANAQQLEQNNQIAAEIGSLKNDLNEVEARARKELGMVKPDETFFMIIDDDESGRVSPER